MDLIKQARENRMIIEKQSQCMPEKEISKIPWACPHLKEHGNLIKAGTRIFYDGEIFVAQNDLWDRPEYFPNVTPILWKKIKYKNGYRYIPEVITVAEVFRKGECGWWKDELYRSKYDSNNWNPERYPDAWEKVMLVDERE